MSDTRAARPTVFPDLLIDAVLVVAFVLIGRRSHDEQFNLEGSWQTAWPFLAALVLGWLVTRAWRRPDRVWPTGVVIWLVTVAGGMGLRALSGQGTDIAFVLVATFTVGAFLIGWRLLGLWIERILTRRKAAKQAVADSAAVNAAAQAAAKAQSQAARTRRDPNHKTPGL